MDVVLCRGVGTAGGRLAGYFKRNRVCLWRWRWGCANLVLSDAFHVEHDALTHKHTPVLMSRRTHCLQANAPLCRGGQALLRHFLARCVGSET